MTALRLITTAVLFSSSAYAQSRQAPPGMFKDLDDEIAGGAAIVRGAQLFVDDVIIEEMSGVEKSLHQPIKYEGNPILVRDKPWEDSGPGYGTVHFDVDENLFKMWYSVWKQGKEPSTAYLCYAVSSDGIEWTKPIIDDGHNTNLVQQPDLDGFQCPGIFKDLRESNPNRRYKMLFSCAPDGTSKTWMSSIAFSPDGLTWQASDDPAVIPFSDTQLCPFWDQRQQRYVAFLRFGPPNTRIISRIESEDFLHWSPKVTVLRKTKMDDPMATQFYQMAPFPYGNYYFGLIAAYHNETLKQPTTDSPWTDRKNLQLAYSRNGVTWSRVGKNGTIPTRELNDDKDWLPIAQDAIFLPYGEKDKDWDWGTVSPYFTPQPIIVNDEIWMYYMAQNGRNWWTYTGDPPKFDPDAKEPDLGVGLAKLRLDGFVSIDAGDTEGTLTTKPLIFLGDTLEVNTNAEGGSLLVEALDEDGNSIEGFGKQQADPISSDHVRHVVRWNGDADCHLLQGRPIRLRFHLKNSKLYSFTPRITLNHYLQSYD
ncbi:MAG: hypothetical protein O2955_03220 [Planctomycetota bacterium]|nr:hypothetical protein [Planctomycetota bacterium]MDA1211499.1 hypothetical protein [Planctomycetota bacterium]